MTASSAAAQEMAAASAQEHEAAEAVALLQVVADPIRWVVLHRLSEAPSCVCNLQEHIPVAANLLSYHLKILREAGLVTGSRRGRWIDYALAEGALERLHSALPGPLPCTPAAAIPAPQNTISTMDGTISTPESPS